MHRRPFPVLKILKEFNCNQVAIIGARQLTS